MVTMTFTFTFTSNIFTRAYDVYYDVDIIRILIMIYTEQTGKANRQ